MDTYMRLRRRILDSCKFDAVATYSELKPYYDRLERHERISDVIKSFVNDKLYGRKYSLRVMRDDGSEDLLSFDVKGSLRSEPFSTISSLPREEMYAVAKKIIVALSQLDEILMHGRKTGYVPNDPSHKRHAGAKFVYSLHAVSDEGNGDKFPAVAEILLPTSGANQVYQLNVKGSSTFKGRVKTLKGSFSVSPTSVTISMVEA